MPDLHLVVREVSGGRAIVEESGSGRRLDLPVDQLDWAGRAVDEWQEAASARMLETASRLGEGVHPESAAATLAPWVQRVPRGVRTLLLLALAALAVVSFVLYVKLSDSVLGILCLTGFILLALLSTSLSYSLFERRVLRLLSVIDEVLYRVVPFLAVVPVGVLVVLWVVRSAPEERLEVTIAAIGFLLFVRLVNDLVLGRTRRRRAFRVTFARHTHRVLVGLVPFVASWVFLLGVTRGDDAAVVNPLALAAAVIGAVTASVGAFVRSMVRQRKHATQVVSAVDELLISLRTADDPEKLVRNWLALDRTLSSGVDTGAPMFATGAESEHVRALVAVCIAKIARQSTWDASWKLLRRAEVEVAEWDVQQCKDAVAAHLVDVRKLFATGVDTAA